MNNKNLILGLSILIINLMLFGTYFTSCQGTPDKRSSIRKVDVVKPAKNIEERSNQQKSLAEEAAKIAPEVEPEMDEIIDLSDSNIEDAKKIQGLQKAVDEKDTTIINLKDDLKDEKKAHIETKESLEKAHKNTLVKILCWMVAAGLLALAGGIGLIAFTFYTQQKFSKMGLIVAVSGGAIAGLAIFTIYYLKTIAITVGIMVIIVIVIAIIKAIAMSRAQKESLTNKKIAKELVDTWEEGRETAKEKHSLETKQMVLNRKFENEKRSS